MEAEFAVIKDYSGDDGFFLNRGEQVKVLEADDDDPTLKKALEVSKKVQKRLLLDNSTARYKITIRPTRKHCHSNSRQRSGSSKIGNCGGLLVQVYDEPSRKGLVPMDYLKKVPPSRTQTPDSVLGGLKSKRQEAKFQREVCISELIETEDEFGKDLQRVVEHYLTPLEEEVRPAPKTVMDHKDILFNNLGQISAFHNGVMIPGVKYFLKEPKTIGRTLLRLERDFDKHAEYIRTEPVAQELLMKNDEIRDYFEDLSQEIGDDKLLADHLKLPLQRINDYTLLLQDLIKYSKVLSEDTTDLERALELMLWIPTLSNDLKFITNIEGFHGNIHKLGRLIRRNWFLVKDKTGGKGSERYCFLFKSRLLVCKVRRISEDRVVFVLKNIIKLPEVNFKNRTDKVTFEIHCSEPDARNFPFTFMAHEDDVKADWLNEIQYHLEDHLTLTEHTTDDLKIQGEDEEDPFEPLKGVEMDISPDIEESLGPIEHPGRGKLKHVPEPKRPPLEIPKKRKPIFECVDPSPSPSPEPEPEPESELEPLTTEEETIEEEIPEEEEVEEEVEDLVEMPSHGKRKPKYIPGVSKPLFHSTIRGLNYEPGEDAVFECEIEGVENMTWLKDNRPLPAHMADRVVTSHEGNTFRLEIKNVREEDSGTYTAKAENDCGASLCTAHLIVEKVPDDEKKALAKATSPVFLVQLKDAELLETTHARFLVQVNGHPMPEVQFFKGDSLIAEDDEFVEINREKADLGIYEMVLLQVRPEDAGEYKCVASNKYSDESCSCIVTVINEKDILDEMEEELQTGEVRFSWLKNGKPFIPEERFKVIYKDEEDSIALVFQNVKPEDAGLYTCIASTTHGKISCSAELTIQGVVKELQKLPKKPKIECVCKEFEGNVGSTVVIEVKMTGDPLPTARWFKNGEEIIASARYKIIFDEETELASLVIRNVTLEDTGEYNVVAKNEVGSDSQFINLQIKAPPKITKKLEDFTGLTGKELRLTIHVEASPRPIVQWYKNGMMIMKSNRIKYVADEATESYTLVIDSAVMDDAGTYSVVASNEFCQVSDVCHLSMESPPQFLGSMAKEVEILEGDYVTFSVMVEGDPLPSVKWKFDHNEIVNDGKHFKMSSEGNVFTLLISEVKREDLGLYSCEIYNQWGGNECDGRLVVRCLPRFEQQLEDLKVNDSDVDVTLIVKMNAHPAAKVTWFKDSVEITPAKRDYTCIEESDTYQLVLRQATTQMSGVYKCRAENEVGATETSSLLTVHTFPKFKKELINEEITEGETLKLNISCEGVPEPEVVWYHNKEEIYSDSRIKLGRDAKRTENYSLTISPIQKEDRGEYEVRGTNGRGTSVTTCLVTVKEFPQILSGMEKDVDTFESLNASFEVVGYGYPRPNITWLKDNMELHASKHFVMTEDGDKYKMEIMNLKATDEGVYTAKLSNSVGEKSKSAKLLVSKVENLRGPKLKQGIEAKTITKRQEAFLEAKFIADPTPDAVWMVDGRDVNAEFSVDVVEIELGLKECTYRMTIPSSDLSDTGTYIVKIENKFGSAESSNSLTIVMEPVIEVFRDLVVPPTMPCTFEATVMATPEPEIAWYFNGQKITANTKYTISCDLIDQFRTVHRIALDSCSLTDEGTYEIEAVSNVGKSVAEATLKLYTEKPVFAKLLEDVTVQDNDSLQMTVRVNGLPIPELKWFRDGKEIYSDDHTRIEINEEGQLSSTLTIDPFTKDDVAEFKVTAKNLVGNAETSAKLILAQIEPSFAEPLKRVTEVGENEPLNIITKIIGSPVPVVQWFKDGEEIKPDDELIKISASPNGLLRLTIDQISPSDCGAYKAVAINELGKSIANTAVVVTQTPKKPNFTNKLGDISVVEGEPIRLKVHIDGFPQPTIKWVKDGHTLHPCPQIDFIYGPNNIYGLTIDKGTLSDIGCYSAIISNYAGEASNSCYVKVTPAFKTPEFQIQLQPVKVVEGYPAKLEVKVGGFPLPKLDWYLNGALIQIDNEKIKLVTTPEGNHCLLIEKVKPEDAGEYQLYAKNDIGEQCSKARLTVASRFNSEADHEKPLFLHGLRDVTVEESEELSIAVPFRGNPIPDVLWFKDGTLVLPNERVHFTCDGYKVGLEIHDINMGDQGFYSCTLKNPYGEDSTAGHVGIRKLYQTPSFTQRFRHQQQLLSHDVKFHCRVTGVPFPSVVWHRNGLPISNNNKYQIKRDGDVCCLSVFNVNHEDEATYSCIASNRDGTATCEAQLQVIDKFDAKPKQEEAPQFLKKIGDCEIYPGMIAKFTACASGYPEPEYEWFCDTIRLHPSDRIEMEREATGLVRLKIIAANPDTDSGRYRLRAINPHGEAFCEANIIFDSGLETKHRKPVGELYSDFDRFRATGAPLPLPDKPIICSMTDCGITLSWKPSIPITPREPVTYLVEEEEQPNGKWLTARAGLRNCICDIHNLKPFVDYKFRVRVENNYGISDPSPFAITHREKLEPEPPIKQTHLPANVVFHPDTCHYFPKEFDIERPPHDNYALAPRFLRQEYDPQYGAKGHNVNLSWFVYGYPKPKISYYFNDEIIAIGGRYDYNYTRNGRATLFINEMSDLDVGIYEAVAVNEHGTARQRIQVNIAEYPEFLIRPEETFVPVRKTCRLEANVTGVPYPEIKWYKDWQPLAPSSRIQIEEVEPNLCILRITEVMVKDEGLYSISARNIAGSVSTSVYMHIKESDHDMIMGGKRGNVVTRNKKFEDIYDFGDELGRGTQGILLHVVERNTGKNLAAKVMHGTGECRKWMANELDIMNHLKHKNIIRPYDSLTTSKSYTIIQELASGGELLDVLTRKTFITEYEVRQYIKQLLSALDHMHDYNIAHLGLTPGDLLISHPGSNLLKLTDFGLSRRINSRKLEPLFFGMPEFVAPEVVNGEGINLSTDMWSVGVITHLLLTGISLFRGRNDVDTLERIKEGRFSIDTNISTEARDFIIKLIMTHPNDRLDIQEALNHRWIKMSDSTNPNPLNDRQINTENLRNYYNSSKDWYSNASCQTWFRRNPLSSAYDDPSQMMYPAGRSFTPVQSPEPQRQKETSQYRSWKDRIPSREPLDIDIDLIKSQSHYQSGSDTYLVQLRDVDFPCRLREYMKVAKRNTQEGFDWQAPVIRERRKFTDIMDEEIDDERKSRIYQYGSADIYTLRRLKQEIASRPTAHVEAEAILGSRIDGLPPFFREKPQMLPIEIDMTAELVCYAVGSPKPLVQWFKNDLVLTESNRLKIVEDKYGRSILRLDPVTEIDLGIYKVVARNKFGQTVARTRLVPAKEPSPPEAPEVLDVSDTEVLLKWKQPKHDGNSPVLCYGLQYQENDDGKWKTIAENIDHEAWLVHGLNACIEYQFRLLAMNKIGWSSPGFASVNVKTKLPGAEKLIVPHVLSNLQRLCENGKEIIGEEPKITPDYTLEYMCLEWAEQPPEEKYRFISEITRGKFSSIVKAVDSTNGKQVVAKLVVTSVATEPEIDLEFEVFRTLRHERIVGLIEAFKLQFCSVAIFIMERLQGADVLTYLSSRHTYTEQMIANVITQVLDGLQYMHWKGYCHFNLQPDNVVMASVRSFQVKLIDFSCAQHVHKLGTVVMNKGPLEYAAPEVLCHEPAYPYSDIWSVGVLTYILLSGVSPFRGFTELETRQNITFVRYRFEYLYKDLSQEATRFIMQLFKRTPTKRPSAEECHEHRWLLPTEYMIKKRERNHFDATKLKVFSNEYHKKRNSEATTSRELLTVIGGGIERSSSIVEELEIMNSAAR